MGDGFFEPGVQDNQSLVVQWQSNDSGLGVVPELSLAKAEPVTFEEILDFLCAHEAYDLAKSISSEALTKAQEHQVQSFLDDTDVKIALGLCELEQLQSFISVFDINRQRGLLLDFGHYDAAIALPGWEEFAKEFATEKEEKEKEKEKEKERELATNRNNNTPAAKQDETLYGIDAIPISNGQACSLYQRFQNNGIIGTSPAILRPYLTCTQIAAGVLSTASPAPIVLIQGSPGSGKSMFAQMLHDLAKRPGPLRRINLLSIAPELLNAELYGHEKGAFTGAATTRVGYFEECKQGGTVVLDDINHMPRHDLYKFLQCFEERTITRMGSNEPIKIPDCMTVLTSNQDLRTLPDFPPDLLERISGHVITLPDILDRQSDIPLLVQHFMGNNESNPMAPFRFQIARKIKIWANQYRQLSIRSIRNEIAGLRQESQDISDVLFDKDIYSQKILAAVCKLYPDGGKIVKKQVAEELGISSRSLLSDTNSPYGRAWKQLTTDGTIS